MLRVGVFTPGKRAASAAATSAREPMRTRIRSSLMQGVYPRPRASPSPEEIGDRSFHGTVALMLAELRYARGRYDDARAMRKRPNHHRAVQPLQLRFARFDRGLPTGAGGPPRGGASAVVTGRSNTPTQWTAS